MSKPRRNRGLRPQIGVRIATAGDRGTDGQDRRGYGRMRVVVTIVASALLAAAVVYTQNRVDAVEAQDDVVRPAAAGRTARRAQSDNDTHAVILWTATANPDPAPDRNRQTASIGYQVAKNPNDCPHGGSDWHRGGRYLAGAMSICTDPPTMPVWVPMVRVEAAANRTVRRACWRSSMPSG